MKVPEISGGGRFVGGVGVGVVDCAKDVVARDSVLNGRDGGNFIVIS